MALSWTMDKLGPICRSVEDCALVLDVIHGADGKDLSAVHADFNWDPNFDWRSLRVGYLKSEFDPLPPLQLKEAALERNIRRTRKTRRRQCRHAGRTRAPRLRPPIRAAALDKLTKMGVT